MFSTSTENCFYLRP